MSLFKKAKEDRVLPQSYRPQLGANEVIELFSRMTLHQQAALLRLMSRNLVVEIDGETTMGFELDYEVDGALIRVSMAGEEED